MDLAPLTTGVLEQGLLFGFLGLGVLISFRFFRFPDLTSEGSYPLGGAVAASLIVVGLHPAAATAAAVTAGAAAGAVTALVHTKLRVNNIISGIVVMTALYSVNLRIMGRSNVPLLGQPTLFRLAADVAGASDASALGPWPGILVLGAILTATAILLRRFLHTDLGLAIRATGENELMVRGYGVDPDRTKLVGLGVSNGVIALSGALVAQNHGFADIGMGIGVLVTGAAAVLIGEAIFGDRSVGYWVLASIVGVLVYRFLVALALQIGMRPTDLRLITAVLVLGALSLPRLRVRFAT